MNFKRDLINIVKHYFATEDISFVDKGDTSDFAARYCEMRIRRIDPRPRDVHFSREIHDSLGKLVHESDKEQSDLAIEAWHTVFYLRQLFVSGGRVQPNLSRCVENATTKDGLLWDYGMHHFHLCRNIEKSGFVKRSKYLLFAIVADTEVFFVDVRMHTDPEKLQWVRQSLLRIVNENWPALTNSRVLHGVSGSTLTDEEIRVLRDKNANHITNLGGQAVAPLGWGTNSRGGSIFCRVWGHKLVHEIEQHERYFYCQQDELRAKLKTAGNDLSGDTDFELVPLDSLNLSNEVTEILKRADCLSADLSKMGFAIVAAKTKTPIVVTLTEGQ
ncbi:MAG: hypothetical protein OYM47_20920 [Gemmatimonadota bacterium]|nr:hypothetical protein [Gemmatimonadota bacterium]